MTSTYRTLLEQVLGEGRDGKFLIQTSTGNFIAKTGPMYVDVGRKSADAFDSIDEAESLFDSIVKDFKGMKVSDLTVVPA